MGDIRYFKAFKLGDLFEFKNDTVLSKPNKYLDISKTQTEEYPIALVSTSSKNNGIIGYISRDEAEAKERIGYLTLDKLFGNCFYQEQEYVNVANVPDGYIDIVDPAVSKTFTSDAYRYMSKLINHLSINSGIYGYNYTFSWERFCREIILLPVISCEATESIWEDIDEDGNITYLTLDVEYIKELMETAKKRKEEKTIRFYEAQAAKYELEKAKYESNPDFVRKLKESHFKAFKLGDLFDTKNGRDSKIAQKNLDKQNISDDEYDVSIITESAMNNGVGFYMRNTDIILKDRVIDGGLTLGTQFGNCNYHDYPHFIIGNVNYLFIKTYLLDNKLDINSGRYLSTIINKIFRKSNLFGFTYKIDQVAFNRELILLPTLEEEIQPEIMAYYYILGQERLYQNKINHYNQLIGG